jgi:hypothetical protein
MKDFQIYRDNLANELKSTRKTDPVKAETILHEATGTDEYKQAKIEKRAEDSKINFEKAFFYREKLASLLSMLMSLGDQKKAKNILNEYKKNLDYEKAKKEFNEYINNLNIEENYSECLQDYLINSYYNFDCYLENIVNPPKINIDKHYLNDTMWSLGMVARSFNSDESLKKQLNTFKKNGYYFKKYSDLYEVNPENEKFVEKINKLTEHMNDMINNPEILDMADFKLTYNALLEIFQSEGKLSL